MTESRTEATRNRLLTGALTCLLDQGIAKASARTIAAAAGVNQALIFYHFGSVDALLAAACQQAAEQRVARYRGRLAGATSLAGLLDVGREIHAAEHADGNVAVLAQLLAGAQANPELGPATAAGLRLWIDELEVVLDRVLAGTPLAGLVDAPGLARAVAASFIGLELYDGVDPAGSAQAFAALDQLAALAALVDDRNPVVRRAVTAALRHGLKKQSGSRQERQRGTFPSLAGRAGVGRESSAGPARARASSAGPTRSAEDASLAGDPAVAADSSSAGDEPMARDASAAGKASVAGDGSVAEKPAGAGDGSAVRDAPVEGKAPVTGEASVGEAAGAGEVSAAVEPPADLNRADR